MIDVDYSSCTGCGACANVCPKSCVSIEENEQGFLFPIVDESLCVKCGKCISVCMTQNEQTERAETPECYAAYNKDNDIRKNSSSGGLFRVLADRIIEENGVIFGACYDDSFNVCHTSASNKTELDKMMGSKYVQSRITNSFREAEDYLKSGRTVYFSGTPCQILGLKNYLGADYDNLITQDVICHGVPSYLVWKKYLDYITCGFDKEITAINFRDKSTGWDKYSVRIGFSDGKDYSQKHGNDKMMNVFVKNMCLRPSCYHCKAKKNSESDITLGDFWGIETVFPKLNDNKGVSVVLCNTQKGKELLLSVDGKIHSEKTDYKTVLRVNPSVAKSHIKPAESEAFMKEITSGDFNKIVDKYCKTSLKKRISKKIKRLLK